MADKAALVQGFLCVAYFGLALSVSFTDEMFLVHISFVWYRRYIILATDSVVKQITCLLGLVHTFRLSTGRQIPITAGQSSGTQEDIGVRIHTTRPFGRPGIYRQTGTCERGLILCCFRFRK